MSEVETKKRFGFNRWIVLLFIIGGVWALNTYGGVIQPHVQLPAENVFETGWNFFGQDFYITNTIIALLIADVLLLLAGFSFYRYSKKENALPSGITGALEGLLEGLYNLTKETAGKWTKYIFPVFATITLSVLVWNWTELIPGVDSIGFIHHSEHGYPLSDEKFLGMEAIVMPEESADAHGDEHAGDLYGVIPFVRVASTDLNFTLALAVIAVVAVQWIGLKALGAGYLTKFFNTSTLFSVPIFLQSQEP